MEARQQYMRQSAISRDPEDMEDPANAPFLYEGPDGEKFMDWINPGHKLENWAARVELLATGTLEEISRHYSQLYYSRLVKKLNIGPDAITSENNETDDSTAAPMPRKESCAIEDIVAILRQMRRHIKRLVREKEILAQAAARLGCPPHGHANCQLADMPPENRPGCMCPGCWQKFAAISLKNERKASPK